MYGRDDIYGAVVMNPRCCPGQEALRELYGRATVHSAHIDPLGVARGRFDVESFGRITAHSTHIDPLGVARGRFDVESFGGLLRAAHVALDRAGRAMGVFEMPEDEGLLDLELMLEEDEELDEEEMDAYDEESANLSAHRRWQRHMQPVKMHHG